MDTKLDSVSIKLIQGLIAADIRYRQVQFKVNYNESTERFGPGSPAYELAEALDMDFDIINSNIEAAFTGEITKEECSKRIIDHYEDLYLERIVAKQLYWDSSFEEIRKWN